MIKLFTHNDLDGIGCAVLAKLAFKDNVDISYCDYDNIDELVQKYLPEKNDTDMCCITDIRVSDELAQEIETNFENFYLLDHHPTALYLNKYNWCKVQIDNNNECVKTSGTELYYYWLIKNKYIEQNIILNSFVRIVRDYDTWRWSKVGEGGLICKKINDLLYIYGRENFIDWCLNRINEKVFPALSETDKLLLEVKQDEINRYVEEKSKNVMITIFGDKVCGIIFAERYISELGNKICKAYPDIDFVAIINMGNQTVSYRTIKDNIDLGKDVASLFGGGGHPKAAGSQFDISVDVLETVFKVKKERE